MRCSTKSAIVCLLLLVVAALSFATPASARGGGSNIMNSPGYQRALQDSRQKYRDSISQPYTKPPGVYPRKTWRDRGKR
jgi:hypothetical protein